MCFVIMWHFIVSRHSQKWALAGDLHLLHSTLAPLPFMWNVVNKAEHWVLSDINISISDIFCFVSMVRRELPAWIKYINVKSWQFRILFLDNFNFVVGGESSEKWEVVLCCCGAWDGGPGGSDVTLVTAATMNLSNSHIINDSQWMSLYFTPTIQWWHWDFITFVRDALNH